MVQVVNWYLELVAQTKRASRTRPPGLGRCYFRWEKGVQWRSHGKVPPWVGVNFWSRAGGPRMWVHYDGKIVRQELAVLADHGCNVTRSFCYWPDFVPEPEQLDGKVVDRFSDFLDAHVEMEVRTIPTFIVGHMSGQNWDPAWRQRRDLYRDVWMVSQQAWFAAEMARRFGAHPAVAAWLVSNEMPIYGGHGTADEVTSWARLIVQAIRSGGATQPISIGDGAWGVEVSGNDNGFSVRALARLVDFLGPHVYISSDDAVRQSMAAAVTCELCAGSVPPWSSRSSGSVRIFRLRTMRLITTGKCCIAPCCWSRRLARLEQLRLRRPRGPGSVSAPPFRDALWRH